MFTLPACVIASLIGFPTSSLQELAVLTQDFVRCLSPLSDDGELVRAHNGAIQLNQIFAALLNDQRNDSRLLSRIRSESKAAVWEDQDALMFNLIGLMSQTFEATAGLVGNTLVALHQNPEVFQEGPPTPLRVADLVAEVARDDAPIQNTRRFVAKRCTIGDSVLKAGDTVLLYSLQPIAIRL